MFVDRSITPFFSVTRLARKPTLSGRTIAVICRAWILYALTGWYSPVMSAPEPPSVESVQQTASEWVKARIEKARIETEWITERQLLESTIGGLSERAQTLETKRDYLQAKTAKDREELDALDSLDKSSVSNLKVVEGRVNAMTKRLLALRHSLPPRLSTALEMSYRSLASSDLSANERMQLNMTIMTRCAQFNGAITSEKEILDVNGGGHPELLEVIYWGLGYGYALNRTTGQAWLGFPGPQGWQWEPHPETVAAVTKLIAIYQDKADPDFVTVPGRISNLPAETAAK